MAEIGRSQQPERTDSRGTSGHGMRSTKLGVLALGVLLFLFVGWRLGRDAGEVRSPAPASVEITELGILADRLGESSGVVVSPTQPGVLWTHNDSDVEPTVYALDMQGALLAAIPFANGTIRDWEDMAAGPCPTAESTQTCLYIGDIGDNERQYDELTVYVVEEPELADVDATVRLPATSFRFVYPDEPHDAEALVVTRDGDVIVVNKGRSGAIDFYRLARADVVRAMASGERLTAEHVANSGIDPDFSVGRQVTGAAVAPDGVTLGMRTYSEIYFYALPGHPSGSPWTAVRAPCFLGAAEPQGEAIDFVDDSTMVLTSEAAGGRAGGLLRVRC